MNITDLKFLVQYKEVEVDTFIEKLLDAIKEDNDYQTIENDAHDMNFDFIKEIQKLVFGRTITTYDEIFQIKNVDDNREIEAMALIMDYTDQHIGGAVNWLEDEDYDDNDYEDDDYEEYPERELWEDR